MKKIFISLILILTIQSFAYAKKNKFGDYGFIDTMPYPVGQCFNNITNINSNYDDYKIKISFNEVSAIGKNKYIKQRCGIFVFNDAIVGAGQGWYGENNKTVWYIKDDGIHLYGPSNFYTGAMQYALSKQQHKKVLFLHQVPGSYDDEVNMITIQVLRKQGYNTVLPNGGLVESGGVDLFLAGVKRAIENNHFKFGVHSWANDEKQGVEYPRNHTAHQMFLQAFEVLGITEEFYWYTLEVAPADEMYHMTLPEIKKFGLVNSPYKDAIK